MNKTNKILLTGSLLLGLCSCNSNSSITVNFIDENNTIIYTGSVSLKSNINTPELNYVKEGYNFRGWAYEQNATSPKIKPANTLKWSVVKDLAVDNTINMYAVWIEKADLCVAYDAYTQENATVPLSGITDGIKTKLAQSLKAAIDEYFNIDSTINFRAYTDQDIITKCTNITKHGDVDICLGFNNQINKPSYGNLLLTKYNSEYSNISGKTRTLASLNNKDITVFAYNWLNNIDNMSCLGHGRTSTTHDLVIGWGWNGNVGSSPATGVIDYQIWNNVETKLRKYLTSKGYEDAKILTRPYRNSPANTCGENINNDGDVDLLVGFGSNIPQFGEGKSYGNVEVYLTFSKLTIDGNNRYLYQLNTGSNIVNLAYKWFMSEDGIKAFERDTHNTITIGFDMRSTSGVNTTIVNNFKTALDNYVSTNYPTYNIIYKQYNQTTNEEIRDNCLNDNCDILIGPGSNMTSLSGMTWYLTKTVSINSKTSRRIMQLTNASEVTNIMNYINSAEGLASLSAVA